MPVVNQSLTWSADIGYSVSDTYYTGFTHADSLVTEYLVNYDMGNMTNIDFNKFFGVITTDREYLMSAMKRNFDTAFETLLINNYNLQKGLSGKYQIDTITMTQTNDEILTVFDTALNNVTVPSSMFDSTDGSHLQIVFKFVCGDVTSKVSFKWAMVATSS